MTSRQLFSIALTARLNEDGNLVCSLVKLLVLPDSDRQPPSGFEDRVISAITSDVAGDLRRPIMPIGSRLVSMHRAPMPKAAIYKYSHFPPAEDQVRLAAKLGERSRVEPVSHASTVQRRAKSELCLRVLRAVPLHYGTNGWRRRGRRRWHLRKTWHVASLGTSPSVFHVAHCIFALLPRCFKTPTYAMGGQLGAPA